MTRLKRAAQTLFWLCVAPLWLWCGFALGLFPAWPFALRITAALTWIAASIAGWRALSTSRFRLALVLAISVVLLSWSSLRPSATLPWSPDQARLPAVTITGDDVIIDNVRVASYRSPSDYTVGWETRRYDLSLLESADFVLEPFGGRRGVAHTFLTFGFSDGEHLAISIEIHRERGERYSLLRGLFRHFEIVYVVGDEMDLIGLRSTVRGNDVFLYPIRARPENIRAMFVSMLRRADSLRRAPEFYNTLTNTCFSNIVRHVNELGLRAIGPDHRILLPGYADALIHELGVIDFDGTLVQARERFRINGRADLVGDSRAWSRQIRTEASNPE